MNNSKPLNYKLYAQTYSKFINNSKDRLEGVRDKVFDKSQFPESINPFKRKN